MRAMMELAMRNSDGLIGAKEIASRQQIPERFLEQQITALKRAGLVMSQRGASGGCSLARRADEITVLEVIEALDGLVIDMNCIGDKVHNCSQFAQCVIQEVWQESQLKLREYLRSVTIADLVQRQGKLKETIKVGV